MFGILGSGSPLTLGQRPGFWRTWRMDRPIVRVFDWLCACQARARMRHNLATMDDHMLRDIGITRATAEHEASKMRWRP